MILASVSWFDALGMAIQDAVRFFADLFVAAAYALEAIGTSFLLPFYLLGVLPTIFATAIVIVVALAVIKFLFGR